MRKILFFTLIITFCFNKIEAFGEEFSKNYPEDGFYYNLPMVLITPGVYYRNEISSAIPQKGIALCLALSGDTRLSSAELKREIVNHPLELSNDPYDGEKAIIKGCDESEHPLFYLYDKNKVLKTGPVYSIIRYLPTSDEDSIFGNVRMESKASYWLNGALYTIDYNWVSSCTYRLKLSASGLQQILIDRTLCDPKDKYELGLSTYFGWAGDLDRDGKMDFLLNYNYANGFYTRATSLFLSTLAKSGQLVGTAAKYVSSGE